MNIYHIYICTSEKPFKKFMHALIRRSRKRGICFEAHARHLLNFSNLTTKNYLAKTFGANDSFLRMSRILSFPKGNTK